METENIQNILKRVYAILKFSEQEATASLNDLTAIQQVAVSTELAKALSKDEVKALNEAAQKSDEEKKAVTEQIVKVHMADEKFKAAALAAAKKVLDEHIVYLKTRGDDIQKQAIAKILAEIE